MGELSVNQIIQGDTLEVLRQLPDECVDTIITSCPYWGLRDYGIEGQIGLEPTLEEYLEKLLAITSELKRVLKKTGVMFWNHGDNYSQGNHSESGWHRADEGYYNIPRFTMECEVKIPRKSLCLQNYRLILRMIDEQGWILRNIIIWHKPNHMPSSAKDRFANAYEPVFMLTKSSRYYFDLDAVRVPHKESSIERHKYPMNNYPRAWEQNATPISGGKTVNLHLHPLGKNPGDLWTISTQPFPEAHFATFPEKLIEPMIKAACPEEICKKCGKARERIVEVGKWSKDNIPEDRWKRSYKGKIIHENSPYKRSISEIYKEALGKGRRITLGWTDCGCNAGWESGIVLDPFMGSGTTALVALKLGRRFIGIELNPEYVKMAYKRIEPYLNQSRLNEFVEVKENAILQNIKR